MEDASIPKRNTTQAVARNNSHPSHGFDLIADVRFIRYRLFYFLSEELETYFLIHSGTGLSGNGTLAYGTLDKLFTRPCGVSR
jgi:hypothetical protein